MTDNLCLHCGTPVPPQMGASRFCCTGCAYVHDLLHSEGFERFYDLRGDQNLTPVSPLALRERDYDWLETMLRNAEATASQGDTATLRLGVQGLSCIGCVWLMERVFRAAPGAVRIRVNAPRGELYLTWQRGAFDAPAFARQLQRFGYLLGKADSTSPAVPSSFNRRVGLCGAFALNAMAFCLPSYLGMSRDFMFASWFDLVAACSATLSVLVGGTWFAERSYRALKEGVLHIDTPITLGIAAAWLGSMVGWIGNVPSLKYFDFVSIFVFLMLAGRWWQQAAVERNRRRLLQLSPVPESVERIAPQGPETVPLDEVRCDDRLRIRPGEVCPVDAVLAGDSASLSLEWINGESRASPRKDGQSVPSGALNIGARAIEVVTREAWTDSLLCRLATSRESGHDCAPLGGALLRGYLVAVVCIGIIGGTAWWLGGADAATGLQVMISVFVVSCPCALGVAAPFADDLAASWMGGRGVFVRTHGLWPRLTRVRTIIFDKTGTLTEENPVLRNPAALVALDAEALGALRHLVGSNLHPVSRSLFNAAGPERTPATGRGQVEEVIGQGLRFTESRGTRWSLGRPGWRGGSDASAGAAPLQGDTELCRDGLPIAAFSFEDALRPETVSSFSRLRAQHYGINLLSGDRMEKVRHVAEALGLGKDEWQAEMTPDDKSRWVRRVNNSDTLFIGDGANDSLALEASLCSGSPVTGRNFLEHKADFYFLGNSLRFVATLLDIARLRRRAVRRVFAFALAYNLAAVALSLAGHMNPLLAAVLMPLSSVATLGIARGSFGSRLRALDRPGPSSQEQAAQPQGMHGQTSVVPL